MAVIDWEIVAQILGSARRMYRIESRGGERRSRREETVQPAAMLMRSFGDEVGGGLQRADLMEGSLRREGMSVGSQARIMVEAEVMAAWLWVEGWMVRDEVVRWDWNWDWRVVREEGLRTVAMKCVGRGVLVVVVVVSVVVVFKRPLRMAMPIFPVVGLLVGLMDGCVCRVREWMYRSREWRGCSLV